MAWNLDDYPLAEEIGDPSLTAGRLDEAGILLLDETLLAGFEASGGL